jgi:hypothetical protein
MATSAKNRKSLPAFTGQTTGGISKKLYKSDQYHPFMCMSPPGWASLHKMAARAIKIEKYVRPSQVKLLVGFQPNFTGVICTIPSWASCQHVLLAAQNDRQSLK